MRATEYQRGDRIAGQYLVHKALMGGMGEVYLCLDELTQKPIALKTYQRRHEQLHAYFLTEVENLINVGKHPNVVQFHFAEEIDGRLFVFLEWIVGDVYRGTSLRDWLRQGPLDLKTGLMIVMDICRGLTHVQHEWPGYVHRDLKPDNILINQSHVAKITDFGLAQLTSPSYIADDFLSIDDNEPDQGNMAGTPLYMAPEQWEGDTIDPRTDLYAVGCILFETFSGKFPIHGTSLSEIKERHLNSSPPILENHPVSEIVRWCMAKDRKDRPLSAAVLLNELMYLYEDLFDTTPLEPAIDSNFSAEDYVNRGNTRYTLGQIEAALDDLKRAVDFDPSSAIAHFHKGTILSHYGRFEEALADLNRAIDLLPESALLYHRRAETLRELDHLEEALIDLDRSIEIAPDSPTAYRTKSEILLELGHQEEAETNLQTAISLEEQADSQSRISERYLTAEDQHSVENIWAIQGEESFADVGLDTLAAVDSVAEIFIETDPAPDGPSTSRGNLTITDLNPGNESD